MSSRKLLVSIWTTCGECNGKDSFGCDNCDGHGDNELLSNRVRPEDLLSDSRVLALVKAIRAARSLVGGHEDIEKQLDAAMEPFASEMW